MRRNLHLRAALGLLKLPLVFGALLFLPAGTIEYWQAWVLLGVFFVCSLALTVWLAAKDPALLERRMRVGPRAETEKSQKRIMAFALPSFATTLVLPALDRRWEWSHVPTAVVILGETLVVLGFLLVFVVLRENTYGASTIQVTEGQTVISTGPYAVVRHPMYAGALVLMAGIAPALGSWWGVLAFVPTLAGIVWRLLDEERFLRAHLAGYDHYAKSVRYRLVPSIW